MSDIFCKYLDRFKAIKESEIPILKSINNKFFIKWIIKKLLRNYIDLFLLEVKLLLKLKATFLSKYIPIIKIKHTTKIM